MDIKHVRFVWEGDFHRAVKAGAAARGMTITRFVEAALRQALTNSAKEARRHG